MVTRAATTTATTTVIMATTRAATILVVPAVPLLWNHARASMAPRGYGPTGREDYCEKKVEVEEVEEEEAGVGGGRSMSRSWHWSVGGSVQSWQNGEHGAGAKIIRLHPIPSSKYIRASESECSIRKSQIQKCKLTCVSSPVPCSLQQPLPRSPSLLVLSANV